MHFNMTCHKVHAPAMLKAWRGSSTHQPHPTGGTKVLMKLKRFFFKLHHNMVPSYKSFRKFRYIILVQIISKFAFLVFVCTIRHQNGRFPLCRWQQKYFLSDVQDLILLHQEMLDCRCCSPSPPPIQNWNLVRACLPGNDTWLCSTIWKCIITFFIGPM